MEDKIRKVIREQIKSTSQKLKRQPFPAVGEGTDAISTARSLRHSRDEGMSPEEWADAEEAERLAKHPEKDKILKIRKMMDKEKSRADWTPPPMGMGGEEDEEQEEYDKGWYGESLKEAATQLGYLNEDNKISNLLQLGKNASVKMGEDKLYKLAMAFERWNIDNDDKYDELVDPLFMAVELVQDAGTIKNSEYWMYIRSAKNHLDKFRADVDKVLNRQGLNEDDMPQKIADAVNAITGGGRHHASVSDQGDKIKIKFSYAREEFDPEEWSKIINYFEGNAFEIFSASNHYEANYDREEPPEAVPTIYLKK